MKRTTSFIAVIALVFGLTTLVFAEGVTYNRSGVLTATASVGFTKVVDENFVGVYDAEDNTTSVALSYWLTPAVIVAVDVSRVQLNTRTWSTVLAVSKHWRSTKRTLPYVSLGGGFQGDGLVTTGVKGLCTIGLGFKFIPGRLGLDFGVSLNTAFDRDVLNNREFTTNASVRAGVILLSF